MTTPTGDITLGQVAQELGVGLPLTLGDGRVRQLAGVPSGPITLGQCRGKSKNIGSGVEVGRWCNGTTLTGTYADGNGGVYDRVIELNSPTCGYVPPPLTGTYLRQYCDGTTLVGVYANGTGGEYASVMTTNATQCGYVPPRPRGELLSTYCSGTQLWGNFTDGSGGAYMAMIENNSQQCGFVPPPAAGTVLYQFCAVHDFGGEGGGAAWSLFDQVADGNGGSYSQLAIYNHIPCNPNGGGFDWGSQG